MLQNKFWQAFFALAPIITLFIAISFYLGALIYFFGHMPELENSGNVSACYSRKYLDFYNLYFYGCLDIDGKFGLLYCTRRSKSKP